MRVHINRNCLSYGGSIYEAGMAVEIADASLARELVARSKGDFVLESPAGKERPPQPMPEPPAPDGDGLPPVDAGAAVQPKGKK